MIDEFRFEVAGFSLPVFPTYVYLNGFGLGISGLAETIAGGYDGLPPLSVYAMIMLTIAQAFYLKGEVSISKEHFDMTITGAPQNFDQIQMMGYLSMNWSDGFISESIDIDKIVGKEFEIPTNIESGRYKLKLEVNSVNGLIYTSEFVDLDGDVVSVGKNKVIEFTNPNQLNAPTNVKLIPAGDGGLLLEAEVEDRADGVICTIYEQVIKGYKTVNGVQQPEYGYRVVDGIGGYIPAEKGKISSVLKGKVTLLDNNGLPIEKDGLTPGKAYSVKLVAVSNSEDKPYLPSEYTQTTDYVSIPIPNPPVLDVKIIQAGDGKELIEKIDESTGFKYFKSVDQNLQLAYTIINPDENDPKLSSFETEIYIDDMLFDKKIENNKTAGYKGYAYFSLSDGEHYVRIVSKNGYGDKTVYSTKIAVDGTPPELKLDKPKVGELIDVDSGITISGRTEYGSQVSISIDGGEEYVLAINDVNSDGSFEVTRPVTDKTKLEYDVRIKVVDNSGNVTEAVVKVNNAKMQNMKAIKLKHTKSQGSSAVEIYAVALDGNGNEMFRIPKETLNWQLYGDEDGSIYFDRRHQENVILIPGDDEEDYAVMASWEIREDFSLTDVLMKSDITDDSPEPGEEPGSKGGSGKGKTGVIVDDSIYRDVIAAFRNEMSAKADIWAASVYPRINNNLNRQGFKVSIPMESLTQSDYLVFARDPDTSMYESTLEQGMKFVSDIVQFQLLKHDNALPGQYTVTIPYDASKVTNTMKLSVYAYNDQLGKWIRVIDSTVNPLTRSVTFTSQYYGRFAVIEDSRNAGFQDVNIDMWSASRINALTLAGIINGYYGKDGLLYYAPKRDITRGEFIKLLVASTGEELDSNADLSVFADAGSVPDWVLPYIRKAVEKGWVKGRAANGKRYLDVNSPITREEAFTLIYRALINEAPGNIERAGFVDMDSVSDYAVDAINYLASVNIVSGDGSRRVLPKKNITREETAKILYECIRLLAYKKR